VSTTIEWVAADPSGLGIGLARALRLPQPDPGSDRFGFRLRGGDLVIVRGPRERDDRIAAVAVAVAPDAAPGGAEASGAVRLLGVGLATIDLDRGVAAAADRFGIRPEDFRTAYEDGWLGARAWTAETAGTTVIVLEPATEGRLAASLARHGEGPIAVYVGLPGPATRTTRPGPLGPAMLIHGPRAWGPFVLAVPGGIDTPPGGGTIGA
jgi:hypothetical protein